MKEKEQQIHEYDTTAVWKYIILNLSTQQINIEEVLS